MNTVEVSVVTTTWNEKENIEKLVPLIRDVIRESEHEIIVVDDDSKDGTIEAAERLADTAVKISHAGQTEGLLHGMKLAKYPVIVTMDADLENDPKYIPQLLERISDYDIVVASRTRLPRISEKVASETLGKMVGVKDVFSNFRAYKKQTIPHFMLRGGETFGGEYIVIAKRMGMKIGEITYESVRRKDPRIGGRTRANLRILWALTKSLTTYLF